MAMQMTCSPLSPISPIPTTTVWPEGVTVFERGWLSSNNVLLDDGRHSVLIDTGYCTHAEQTLALVTDALGQRALDAVANTHLHSDHCGGNAALQAAYPQLTTAVPPGLAAAAQAWDVGLLGFEQVGQSMVRFAVDRVLRPGHTERWAGQDWEVHAAPGHDSHAVLLFQPASGVLISGDALWQHGFGVVFPVLDGAAGFDDVASTLDLIASLRPRWVIPGHGAVFSDVSSALATARQRLDNFVQHPSRHHRHAVKVLLKYKLLEWGRIPLSALHAWVQATPMFHQLYALLNPEALPSATSHGQQPHAPVVPEEWINGFLADLCRSQAASMADAWVCNEGGGS